MPAARYSRNTELTPGFFTTVFSDTFIFGGSPSKILQASPLSQEEKALAMHICKGNLYSAETMERCASLCNQTGDIFHWQDHSEGPLIFAGAILCLLEFKGKDVNWFIQKVKHARQVPFAPPPTRGKKQRATLIVPTPEGILLARDFKKLLLLPGGSVERNELPIAAATRELHEETTLQAEHLEFLFAHESTHYQHQVFIVHRYSGKAAARSDATGLKYLQPQEGCASAHYPGELTRSHCEILERYRTGDWQRASNVAQQKSASSVCLPSSTP